MKNTERRRSMDNLPISDYMKSFFKENGVTFTDFEKAVIIWNSDMPLAGRIDAIREIVENTADDSIANQIRERIEYEKNAEKAFRENSDGKCVYVTSTENDEDGVMYFNDIDNAVSYALKEYSGYFTVTKNALADEPDRRNYKLGAADYTVDGKILHLWTYEYPDDLYGEEGRFETSFVFVDSPFEIGDFVKDQGSDKIGIVADPAESVSDLHFRIRSGKTKYADFTDVSIRVFYPNGCGGWFHFHCCPLDLEKVDIVGDELWHRFYKAASDLLKGRGDLEWYSYVCEEYRRKNDCDEKE